MFKYLDSVSIVGIPFFEGVGGKVIDYKPCTEDSFNYGIEYLVVVNDVLIKWIPDINLKKY